MIEEVEPKDKINVEPTKLDKSQQEASSLVTKEEEVADLMLSYPDLPGPVMA